ncbi:MAG: cheD [Bacteroidetes bacterium]|nr:cheD [Bacteroidota bacterium]
MSSVLPKKHYLYPSALFAEPEPYIIDTVLGSCVAVCLYDQKLRRGGINHYMLPFWNGEGLASPKFGNIAIEKLLERMIRQGSKKSDLVAKVFGGANQMNATINIGARNIQIAEEMLAGLNIRIISKSMGGTVGRKMSFNSESGEILMRFLK